MGFFSYFRKLCKQYYLLNAPNDIIIDMEMGQSSIDHNTTLHGIFEMVLTRFYLNFLLAFMHTACGLFDMLGSCWLDSVFFFGIFFFLQK